MSSPFRIGVAGVGAIGKNHARIMAEIAARSEGAITFENRSENALTSGRGSPCRMRA